MLIDIYSRATISYSSYIIKNFLNSIILNSYMCVYMGEWVCAWGGGLEKISSVQFLISLVFYWFKYFGKFRLNVYLKISHDIDRQIFK